MKVLKHGMKEKCKFSCHNCLCVYVANPSEYKVEKLFDSVVKSCKCPECGNWCRIFIEEDKNG